MRVAELVVVGLGREHGAGLGDLVALARRHRQPLELLGDQRHEVGRRTSTSRRAASWAEPSEPDGVVQLARAASDPCPPRSADSPLSADFEPVDRSCDAHHTTTANTTMPISATSTAAVAMRCMRSRDRRDAIR